MRTTIELPDDLHRAVQSIAVHTRRSMNQTVADLIRRGLAPATPGASGASTISLHGPSGLPVFRSARVVTPEDVRALDDE